MLKADHDTVRHPKLGRYELVGKIATGGMATVYLSRLVSSGGFNREFALKVIHPHLAEEDGFTERFTREARLASRVRHHNIVSTVDAGQDLGYAYLVLELVEGFTLRQLIVHRDQPFGFVAAAQILADAAKGLHALHTATDEGDTPLDIVHRDLSPHNIMLDRHGRTVLIDLGLAKAAQSEAQTQVGVMMGKLPYMSPEQSRLEDVDARSDVFALGTVLFELCTGAMPFGDTHTTKTLERLNECDTGPVARTLNEHGAPRWLIEIILSCLRKDPDERYQTALDVSEALVTAIAHAGHDAAEIRRQLAKLVTEAMPEIGKVIPVEGIVARIPPLPPTAEVGPRSWLRWAVAGALVAGLGALGVRAFTGMGAQTAALAPDTEPAGLASDAAASPSPTAAAKVPAAEPPKAPEPRPGPDLAEEAATGTGGTGEGTGVSLEAADTEDDAATTTEATGTGSPDATRRKPRRPRRRVDSDAERLKPNPYAKPKP